MAVPKRKVDERLERLRRWADPPSEVELNGIIELSQWELQKPHMPHDSFQLQSAITEACHRLGRYEEGLMYAKSAASIAHMLQQPNMIVQADGNVAVHLMNLGESDAALNLLKPLVLDRDDKDVRAIDLANLAEALHRLGFVDEAYSVFDMAVERCGDKPNHSNLMMLAMQAAEIGRNDAAVDFFMRIVDEKFPSYDHAHAEGAAEALDRLPPPMLTALKLPAYRALWRALSVTPRGRQDPSSPEGQENLSAFHETTGSRKRATLAVIGGESSVKAV